MAVGALADLKVIECGSGIPAAYAAKLLADLGADVIKVEPPAGDAARRAGPFPGHTPDAEKSGLFLYLNLNKLGTTLDLANPGGQKLLRQLAADADVLVHDHHPTEVARLGLSYERLRRVDDRLIVAAITPFGLTGPRSRFKGTDLTAWFTGSFGYDFPWFVDDPDKEPPWKGGGRAADYLAGVTATVGIMQALFSRFISGRGQLVDVSEQEAIAASQFEKNHRYNTGRPFSRAAAENPPGPLVGVLPCKDGYCSISPRENHQWAYWVEAMGNPAWTKDPRFASRELREENWSLIEPLIAEWSKERSKDEVYRLAQEKHVPAFPVNTTDDLLVNPQLQHREFFREVEHPVAGKLTYPGVPYRGTGMGWNLRRPAPRLGEHNQEIYGKRLGYSPDDLARLRQMQVI